MPAENLAAVEPNAEMPIELSIGGTFSSADDFF
jgi:hypothetical protein